MPSPVGHALGAIAAGWLAGGVARSPRAIVTQGLLLAAVGIAPDLDLLVGRHSAETHSIGAAVIAGVVAAALRWPVATTRGRVFCAVTLAWLSHPILDWLGSDDSPPLGVMAFWPFSQSYYFASAYVFDAINRRYWMPGFWLPLGVAVVREVAMLTPIAAFVWFARRRRRQE